MNRTVGSIVALFTETLYRSTLCLWFLKTTPFSLFTDREISPIETHPTKAYSVRETNVVFMHVQTPPVP